MANNPITRHRDETYIKRKCAHKHLQHNVLFNICDTSYVDISPKHNKVDLPLNSTSINTFVYVSGNHFLVS